MIERLRQLGIEVRSGARGDVKTTCPKCSPTRKNKTDPCLSVNADTGVWNCHNCGWHGVVKAPKKEYNKPQSELKKLSDSVVKWFAARGISNQTLLRYKISEGSEYMPQAQEQRNTIQFNYFYEGELVNIKFRDREKNFKLVSGAMLCPYGIDVALDNSNDELVIVEGEIDVLSFYEAGIKNTISVPNGASKGNQKLEWLEDIYGLFEGRRILLATDMDEPGVSLRNELARRFGKSNCWVVSLPEKDANETLVKHGKDALMECYNSATPYPVEGVEDANSKSMDLLALYDQGYPEGCDADWGMDDNFKWFPAQVTLITGIPGSGKTTWLKNVLVRLADRHGWKNLIYSAEEANTEFALADLISIHTNKSFFHSPFTKRVTKEEVEQLTPFLSEHFKYYKLMDNDLTIEGVIGKAEEMVKRHGINALVIDNMSTIERGMSKNSDNRHHTIGEMMGDIVKFARNYGVHVFIVAHPKKMAKLNGKYDLPTGYDVGDSSHYYNKPDNGLTVHRNRETGFTEVHRWKVRFRYTGQEGVDYFKFDINTSRYSSTQNVNDGSDKTKFKGQPLSQGDYGRLIKAGSL
jgi:twinkle protein